jgi:DNA repair exonuclease SbcCD ATPase subunit
MRWSAAWLVSAVMLGLLGACRSTPHEEVPKPNTAPSSSEQLVSLGEYALKLRQQDEPALRAEKDRLEAAPASTERDLRLALVLGQHLGAYDPERAASLLAQLSVSESVDPTSKAIAQMLLTSVQGGPGSWIESDEFRELTAQLSVEQQKRQETAARLESVRQELEAERAQRAKLEQQLEALKSLEEQIKNRDSEPGR